jgi:hypothetical protein
MPSLAAAPFGARTRALGRRPIALALVAVLGATAPAAAQTTPSHTEDAAPVPAGMLRLRLINAWTRFDERFAANGDRTTLGSELSADSLGSAQLPRLLPIEAGLRSLSSDPTVRLSLGRLEVGSNARIVTTPIALEYGVTRRLSVGVLIPIVQTRRVAQARVTGDISVANVGYVPSASRTAAATANANVATAFRRAADSLGKLLANCPSNPTAAGCASVNANVADATATRARAQSFADAVTTLGVDAATALIAPRDKGPLATAIDAQRLLLNQRLQQYLGASAGASAPIFSAPTDFSYIDLQGRNGVPGLLGSPLGGGLDSIHTTERIGFGDVAVGARYMVFDRFQRDTLPLRRLQSRLAVGGALRFATSRPDSARQLVDIPTGDGAGFELHSAWDVIVGHFGGTVAARYVKSLARSVQAPLLGDPEAPFPYPLFGTRKRTAGDVVGLDVTPRLLMNETFALDAHYGFERTGATTYDPGDVTVADPCASCQSILPLPVVTTTGSARTAQRLGLGLRYSTVNAYARGRARYPIEVSFVHLGTVSGDPGVPVLSRDQIQVRLYYRLFRR